MLAWIDHPDNLRARLVELGVLDEAFTPNGGLGGTVQVFDRDKMLGGNIVADGDDFDFDRQEDGPEGLAAAIAPFMLGQQVFGVPVMPE